MRRLVVLLVAFALPACSTVRGSAIRTGSVHLPAYAGPVSVHPTGLPPEGATDLGVVEVHASETEATVDTLLPQFVRRVAKIGGNAAVIDGVRARFEIIERGHVETFYYTCGFSSTCAGTRVYTSNVEVMTLSMFGHAYTTERREPVEPLEPAAPTPPEPKEDEDDAAHTPGGI